MPTQPTVLTPRPVPKLAAELLSITADLTATQPTIQAVLKSDLAEVTAQLQSTITLARDTAQTLMEVFGDYGYTFQPLLKTTEEEPWGLPSKGRSAVCFYALDRALAQWTAAQKLLDQLTAVPSRVQDIAKMPPQRRQQPIKDLVAQVQNLSSLPETLTNRVIPAILQHSRDVNRHLRSK